MSIDVGDRLPIPGISEKFHRVCNDGFFGVRVSSTSSGRYGFSEPLKAGVGFVLDNLVHAIHYETVREVPESESESERYLFDPHKKLIQSNNEKQLGSGDPY